ncbi:MAG: MBL fold metallo-hydrolase [Deltaproteobacteria bacterium]|nr:MAG: MBL fold metallo-hydrolase [Deltaproteobacteria bacterium]
MIVQQFFVKGLAHSSYLVGGTKTCAIIDPRRDIGIYLDAAKSLDMEVTHILETHLHADFISGHLDLANKTGAKIYAPEAANCAFDHTPMAEGNTVTIEDMAVRVLETPGHTPEHISYVVVDEGRGTDPVGVFCGDTLFVGDVGRPDLFPGKAQELASQLYESLNEKLLKLPDFCEVYPAHGAGSLCGRAMGAKRTSTIGYERKYNAALQIKDKKEFIASLTTNMPAAPDHFSRCSAINGSGPALVQSLPVLEPFDPESFHKRAKASETVVLDVRSYDAFGGQHVPGSYHIDLSGNFATFAGWILPPDKKILLVALDGAQAEEAAVWLRRVGLDRSIGYLEGGMFEWAKAGLLTGHVGQLSVEELHEMSTGDRNMTIVDVRAPNEYQGFHIEGAVNIPAPDLRKRHSELDPAIPTVLLCSTGHRSSLGASILKQHGFTDLFNGAGGMTAYAAAGYGPECPICVIPHGPHFMGKRMEIMVDA